MVLAVVLALLLSACAMEPTSVTPDKLYAVSARVETQPVETGGDAADDPAIWLHPDDPSQSLILGTNKRASLNLYDLDGRLLQTLKDGRVNNVDLRYNVAESGHRDLAAASNRSFNGIGLYWIDAEARRLLPAGEVKTELPEIYGLCMGRNPASGETYVYANSSEGTVHQFKVFPREDDVVLRRVRRLKLSTQVEGCVVDDEHGAFYIGEENHGVWRFDAWPGGSDHGSLIARTGEHGVQADVEGLALVHVGDGGYLVVSSQGNNTYAVFDRLAPHAYRGSFEIVDSAATDGATETDGIEVLATALPGYPGGLLVVQDGYNLRPDEAQNFKYVDWAAIAVALELSMDAAYDPRR